MKGREKRMEFFLSPFVGLKRSAYTPGAGAFKLFDLVICDDFYLCFYHIDLCRENKKLSLYYLCPLSVNHAYKHNYKCTFICIALHSVALTTVNKWRFGLQQIKLAKMPLYSRHTTRLQKNKTVTTMRLLSIIAMHRVEYS